MFLNEDISSYSDVHGAARALKNEPIISIVCDILQDFDNRAICLLRRTHDVFADLLNTGIYFIFMLYFE